MQPCLELVNVWGTCRCPAAACPAWLKSSEKTVANLDEASLCWELTQPKDLRMVNIACTRSTGGNKDSLTVQQGPGLVVPAAAALTAEVLPGGTSLFEESVREGLARSGLAGPAASHRAHTVVPPGANHRHIHTFDQRSQGRWSVPHCLTSPRLRSLTENKKKKQWMKQKVHQPDFCLLLQCEGFLLFWTDITSDSRKLRWTEILDKISN